MAADTTASIQQSKLFDETLTRFGVAHHFEIITNAVHTFSLQPPQKDLRPLVLKFLDDNLKSPSPAHLIIYWRALFLSKRRANRTFAGPAGDGVSGRPKK
jgi:hypothetical protein